MSNRSQLVLPQSTTTIAQTPQPSTPTSTATTQLPIQNAAKQRLELYNNLFGSGTTKNRCDETGLQLKESLDYSLYTFLHLFDINWVLAVVDIADLERFDEKYGRQLGKRKMIQIATVIKKFCENDPRKLKGYKYNNDGDLFSLLMYCYPKLVKSEKYISKLIKKIQEQTNELVCVGIAKMNDWETYDEWKQRAMKNLNNAKNTIATETKTQTSLFFSDINVEYVNPNLEKQKKQQEQKTGVVAGHFGTEAEFDKKMQEIANNEDYDWVVALMTIDDFDSFVFSIDNNQDKIQNEINKIPQAIYRLFDIYESFYGNKINGDEKKYFGYNLSRRNINGKFGLILYDSKDINECYVPAHEILETLKDEISDKCSFTVSIGCSRLIEDDLGFSGDWYERAKKNLSKAKTDEICFGGGNRNSKNDDLNGMESVNVHDDQIQEKSFQIIDVCIVSMFGVFVVFGVFEFFSF